MAARHVAAELARRWQHWADTQMAGAGDTRLPGARSGSGAGGPDISDLEPHLTACPACRAEHLAWQALFGALAAEEAVTAAPAGFVQDVLAALPPTRPGYRMAWQGLATALAVCLLLTGLGVLAALVWAPGALASGLAAAARWIGFWLSLWLRLGLWAARWKAGYEALLILHSTQATVAAGAMVIACVLLTHGRGWAQTLSGWRRIKG